MQQAYFLFYIIDAEASVECLGGAVVSGKPHNPHGHGGTVGPSRAEVGPPKAHYDIARGRSALVTWYRLVSGRILGRSTRERYTGGRGGCVRVLGRVCGLLEETLDTQRKERGQTRDPGMSQS